MKLYGLIGKKLTHSFSKKYFTEKFEKENLTNHKYELFELYSIEEIRELISANPTLQGLNVTIPYKEAVLPFLDQIHEKAAEIGAVNVIKVSDGKLCGYNSDFFGFRDSLAGWLKAAPKLQGLVLGTGGASKAVIAALNDLKIEYRLVSRDGNKGHLSYTQLQQNPDILTNHHLIINTTPLGMYPNIEAVPELDYSLITSDHFLYDLVYNPETTQFLKNGLQHGANIKNGLEMLYLQAEKSWKIWN